MRGESRIECALFPHTAIDDSGVVTLWGWFRVGRAAWASVTHPSPSVTRRFTTRAVCDYPGSPSVTVTAPSVTRGRATPSTLDSQSSAYSVRSMTCAHGVPGCAALDGTPTVQSTPQPLIQHASAKFSNPFCGAAGCPYSPDAGALRPGDAFSTARGKPASWPFHGWRLGTIPPLLPWSKERHLIRLRLRPPCSQSPEHLLHFVFHRPRSQLARIAGKWANSRWPVESHRPPQILRESLRATVAIKNWAVSSAGRAGDS